MQAEIWIIGAAIILTAVLVTKNMNEADKGNAMGGIIIGMWAVVLLVLFLVK